MTRIIYLVAHDYAFFLWGAITLLCWQVPRLPGKGCLSLAFLLLAGESLVRGILGRNLDPAGTADTLAPWLRLAAIGCFLLAGLGASGAGWASNWRVPHLSPLLVGVGVVGLGIVFLGVKTMESQAQRAKARVIAQQERTQADLDRIDGIASRMPSEEQTVHHPEDELPARLPKQTGPADKIDGDLPVALETDSSSKPPEPPAGDQKPPDQVVPEPPASQEMQEQANARMSAQRQAADTALRLAEANRTPEGKENTEKAYAEAIDLFTKLTETYPFNDSARASLGMALASRGGFRVEQEDWSAARDDLEKAVDLLQEGKALPKNADILQALCDAESNLAEDLLQLDNPTGAAKAADALPRVYADRGDDYFLAARYLARCAAAADKAELKNDAGQPLAPTYGDSAVSFLQEAVRNGYKDLDNLQKEPDLELLRSRDDFRKVVDDLKDKNPGEK